jgi:hypothetical protein
MLRIALGMVTKGPITRESAEQAVKTIAQGMPALAGEPVVTNSCAFYFAREAAGALAPGIPCAL